MKHKLDSKKLKNFLLYGFSDAGGMEYSRTIPNGAYEQIQKEIFDTLVEAGRQLENLNRPVVVVAHSLGGQVISNYIWDANRATTPEYGFWGSDLSAYDPNHVEFSRLKNLRLLVTTGCNIPIFIAGLPRTQRIPITKPNTEFIWENYYDVDDPLGWPLQELSNAYSQLVKDKEIRAGNLFTGWNPLSHGGYWDDKDVIKPLANHLRDLIV